MKRAAFAKIPRGVFALALIVASGPTPISQSQAADRRAVEAAVGSIQARQLQRHVEVLADDAFEGREAGSRGGRAAGGYLAERLQQAGLRGQGDDGGVFQVFGNGYRNLLAILEGSDPELKRQIIVVGAHYDHVGYGSRRNSLGPIGYIHNGADDNASGAACLLEMAEAFQALGAAPRRSILFALWDGEEQGLLGSKHWVANPTIPLNQVVFSLNSDMLGRLRNNRTELFGSRTSRRVRQIVARANDETAIDIDFNWEMKPNSDHYSFFARGIPSLMLHSGLHDDYHRPSDDADKINSEGLERLSRLWFRVALELADADRLDGFRAQSQQESPLTRKQLEAPATSPPPRLGITFRKHPTEPGIEVTAVDAESAGARAGLKVSDRLTQIGDEAIRSENQFRLAVLAARSPVKLIVERAGADSPVELEAQLPGSPSRIGIAWREDDAEPGTLLINLVLPGSAAAQAGLRVGDRVQSIEGQPIENAAQFKETLSRLPAPVHLQVERAGRSTPITIEPLTDANSG